MSGLRHAVVFLTRIPVGTGRTPGPLGHAVPWFPVVGAAVGALVAGIYAAADTTLPPTLAAALAVAFGLLVTGAFHLDGLADVADAVAGGSTPERRLEILDDPRLGTYGTSAVVMQLLLQVLAVAALAPGDALVALIAAQALGRAAAVVLMLTRRPARDSGLGVDYLADLPRRWCLVGVVVGALPAALLGWWGLVALAAVAVVVVVMGGLARRAFGGIGGDVLGATEQVAETTVLLVAVSTI